MNISAFTNNNPIWQTAVIFKICRIAITQPCISRSCLNLVGWCGKVYRVNKKVAPVTFVDILALRANCEWNSTWPVKQSDMHFITEFDWHISENDKIMLFQPRYNQFLRFRASCRTEFIEKTEYWVASSSPHLNLLDYHICWKSTINFSRSLRWLISWKSPCRPFWEELRWQNSPSAWLPTRLWLCGYQWWSL